MNRYMKKSRLAVLPLAAAAAALPLGLLGATPAQAATTKDGCTVSPQPAEFRGTFNPANLPYVYYPYEVSCVASPGGLKVEVTTTTWEADRAGWVGDVDANGINNADEDRIGSATWSRTIGAGGGTVTVDVRGVLPHTDTDFDEEVYSETTFQVTSGTVTGSPSVSELTMPTTINW